MSYVVEAGSTLTPTGEEALPVEGQVVLTSGCVLVFGSCAVGIPVTSLDLRAGQVQLSGVGPPPPVRSAFFREGRRAIYRSSRFLENGDIVSQWSFWYTLTLEVMDPFTAGESWDELALASIAPGVVTPDVGPCGSHVCPDAFPTRIELELLYFRRRSSFFDPGVPSRIATLALRLVAVPEPASAVSTLVGGSVLLLLGHRYEKRRSGTS